MSISTSVLEQIAAGNVYLLQIASTLGVEKKAVVKAAQILKRRGLIDVPNAKTIFDPELRGIYALTKAGRKWVESGVPVAAGQGVRPRMSTRGLGERAWWHLRAFRTATIMDLLSTYSDGTDTAAHNTLYKYLNALEKAEVIKRYDCRLPAKQGKGSVQWSLSIDLGPRAPVWRQQEREVYDPNTGRKYPTIGSKSFEGRVIQIMREQFEQVQNETKNFASDPSDFWRDHSEVFHLLSDYAGNNSEALGTKLLEMKQTTLRDEDINWQKFADCGCTLNQFKLTFSLWIFSAISKLSEDAIIRIKSLASLCRIIELLGFVPQKSLYPAWGKAIDATWDWRAKELQKICNEANNTGASIYFAENTDIYYKYREKYYQTLDQNCADKEVLSSNCILNMTLLLNPCGNTLVNFTKGALRDEAFRELIKQLILAETTPIFVIVERSAINNSKLIKEFVEANKPRLKLFYIPEPR